MFIHAETALRVRRTLTRKVRLGSPGGLKTPRTSKGQEQKIFRSKDDQKDANTLYEMPGKTSYSSLRRFCQKSASLDTNVNHVIKWVVRAYVSRVGRLSSLRRSSRLHVARQKFSSLLDKPDEKTSTRDSLTFHSVISSASHLFRENSNYLPAISRQEGSKSNEHFRQAPRQLIILIILSFIQNKGKAPGLSSRSNTPLYCSRRLFSVILLTFVCNLLLKLLFRSRTDGAKPTEQPHLTRNFSWKVVSF